MLYALDHFCLKDIKSADTSRYEDLMNCYNSSICKNVWGWVMESF